MARLTWDNVASPNFSGVADSYRVMSQLLGNATQSGMDMINTYKGANAEAADRAILQRLAGVTDPSQFNAQAIIGADGSRASLDTLKGVGNRPGTLLDWAAGQQNLDKSKYDFGRVMEGNAILDAPENRDAVNRARSLAAAGQMGQANQILSTVPGLRTDQYGDILGNIEKSASGALGREVTGQALTENRWEFGNQQRELGDTRNANAIITQVLANAATPEDARMLLQEEVGKGRVSPEAALKALGGVSQMGYGNVFAPVGSGGGAGGTGASAAGGTGTSALSVMTGGNALPPEIKTIGDMVDNKKSLLGFNPKGTATGMYQITSDTWKDFGPKALGEGWKEADIRDPQVQDKVAGAIWDSAKGSAKAIAGRWASIPESRAQSLVGKPWSEVRDIISQGETTTNATSILETPAKATFAADLANRALEEAVGQNNAVGISADYDKLVKDNSKPIDVAKAVIAKGGNWEGVPVDYMVKEINRIRDGSDGRINAAQAGAMLEDSLSTPGGYLSERLRELKSGFGLLSPLQPTLPNKLRVDQGRVDSLMRDTLSGNTRNRVGLNAAAEATTKLLDAATNKYNAAVTQLAAIQKDGRTGNIARYQKQVTDAKMELEMARAATRDPQIQPDFDIPQPVATRPGKPAEGEVVSRGPFDLWQVRKSVR